MTGNNQTLKDLNYRKIRVHAQCEQNCSYCGSLKQLSPASLNQSDLTKISENLSEAKAYYPCNSLYSDAFFNFFKGLDDLSDYKLGVQIRSLEDSNLMTRLLEFSNRSLNLHLYLDRFDEKAYETTAKIKDQFRVTYVLVIENKEDILKLISELPHYVIKDLKFTIASDETQPIDALHVYNELSEINEISNDLSIQPELFSEGPSQVSFKDQLYPPKSFWFKALEANKPPVLNILCYTDSPLDREKLLEFEERVFQTYGSAALITLLTRSPLVKKHSFGAWQPKTPSLWIDVSRNNLFPKLSHILNVGISEVPSEKILFLNSFTGDLPPVDSELDLNSAIKSTIDEAHQLNLHGLLIKRNDFSAIQVFQIQSDSTEELVLDIVAQLQTQSTETTDNPDGLNIKLSMKSLSKVYFKYLNEDFFDQYSKYASDHHFFRSLANFIFAPLSFLYSIPPVRWLILLLTFPIRLPIKLIRKSPKLNYFFSLRWLNIESTYHFWKVHIHTVLAPVYFFKKHIWRIRVPFDFILKYAWWLKKPFYLVKAQTLKFVFFLRHLYLETIGRIWIVRVFTQRLKTVLTRSLYFVRHVYLQFVAKLWVVRVWPMRAFGQIKRFGAFLRHLYLESISQLWIFKVLGARILGLFKRAIGQLVRLTYYLRHLVLELRGRLWIFKVWYIRFKIWAYYKMRSIFYLLREIFWRLKMPFYAPLGFLISLFEFDDEIRKKPFVKRLPHYFIQPLKKIAWLLLYPFRSLATGGSNGKK